MCAKKVRTSEVPHFNLTNERPQIPAAKKTGVHGFGSAGSNKVVKPLLKNKNKCKRTGGQTLSSVTADWKQRKIGQVKHAKEVARNKKEQTIGQRLAMEVQEEHDKHMELMRERRRGAKVKGNWDSEEWYSDEFHGFSDSEDETEDDDNYLGSGVGGNQNESENVLIESCNKKEDPVCGQEGLDGCKGAAKDVMTKTMAGKETKPVLMEESSQKWDAEVKGMEQEN